MTVLSPPPPAEAPPAPAPSPEPETGSGPPRAERAGFAFAGAALCVLAALLLGFAANLTIVGHLQHARDQQTAYDEYRRQLALGIAPVGQQTYDGKMLEPGAPVALLRIPALGLKEVIGEGTTSGVLMSGPGHRRDTPLPGQAGTSVIMGRQWGYGSPFHGLHRLPAGTEIEMTTGQGKATYRVTGVRREGDPLPAALKDNEGRLTLTTAEGGPYTPSGTLRVDATLTSDVQPAPPRPLALGWVGDSEQAFGIEGAAWLPVFLWSQGLFLAALLTMAAYRAWGRWQTWIVGVPVLAAFGLAVSGAAARLLPNLL
ncbi:sortase [Streptomyces shenzhenensis]|uniref:Sortase n=1 Tax=Streptomyces shenzhenensis TaxID=943815 RepID=A0A3M0IHA4_9ACTN|nr:class E sortase [Streptomyces shenzhenensis]RMB87748.1 sortase [Streptomyces shenzhenensis]